MGIHTKRGHSEQKKLSSNKSTFIQLCILYRQDPFCSKLVVFFNFETSIWCLGPLKSPKGIHFVDIDLDMGV